MKRKLLTILLVLSGLMGLLGLFVVYRNHLHRAFDPPENREQWQVGGLTIGFGYKRIGLDGIEYRPMKVSLPITESGGGCEYVYLVAVLTHEPPVGGRRSWRLVRDETRVLVRFAYDHKNSRCESKDLTLDTPELVSQVRLQTVAVSVSGRTITETPSTKGVYIDLQYMGVVGVREGPLTLGYPFMAPAQTTVPESFSADLAESSTDVWVAPYDSLEAFLVEEFARRTERCRDIHDCPPILMAVAAAKDLKIVRAIDAARLAGIPVESIENLAPRKEPVDPQRAADRYDRKTVPLYWVRGELHENPEEKLPMHTKFVIFGDDLVVSSGANYDFDRWYRSRDVAVIYRDPRVVAMFRSVFVMIRTMVHLPIDINFASNFTLLFNASKRRGDAAIGLKPYQAFRDQEGRLASAYAHLFGLLDRTPGLLQLAMSPLSNYCDRLERERCLFDILRVKGKRGDLELFVNAYYYFERNMVNKDKSAGTKHGLAMGRVKRLWKLVGGDKDKVAIFATNQTGGSHHSRIGVLNKQWLLAGSANYANASTLNTIEVLRMQPLVDKVAAEIATFLEPYFVVTARAQSTKLNRFGGCEFVFESPVGRVMPVVDRKYATAELRRELKRRGAGAETGVAVVSPTHLQEVLSPGVPETTARWQATSLSGDWVNSPSSFFCVLLSSGATEVVRLNPE